MMVRLSWCVWGVAVLAAVLCTGCAESGTGGAGNALVLNGSGATFPAPVYTVWAYSYSESTGNRVLVNYQGTGSGAGVNQLREGTVDFAGCDYPLSEEELKESNLRQFPMLGGGIVVTVNLPEIDVTRLELTSEALADIFLGRITKWNDPALTALNPGMTLPDLAITVVHRSDASGTSYLFTRYLTNESKAWSDQVGAGPTVNWPVGVGGQKNPGVCSMVEKTKGAVGYTEYTFARESGLSCVRLRNRAGESVVPGPDTFAATLVDWSRTGNFEAFPDDTGASGNWPVVGASFIVVRNDLNAERQQELTRYFDWCFEQGGSTARDLFYVPLSDGRVQR